MSKNELTTNKEVSIEQVAQSPIDYYPSKQDMSAFTDIVSNITGRKGRDSIAPGKIARTDGLNVDIMIKNLMKKETEFANEGRLAEAANVKALLSRIMSVSDLTPQLYQHFAESPNSMPNWLPELTEAIKLSGADFELPKTTMVRLPIELAQFIRVEYQDTNKKDRDLFDKWVFDKLKLDENKTYFIKTGNFSSKFQFANAKCEEPLEMGQYFQVINNYAMTLGAGVSVDIVAREYIKDPEDNLTMYNGMPLRTEFRAFLDLDKKEVIGVTPYWNPVVVKGVLSAGLSPSAQSDYLNYLAMEDKLMRDYNDNIEYVTHNLQKLAANFEGLSGCYSLDIMKSSVDFYAIDMALMSESALKELLPPDVKLKYINQFDVRDHKEIIAQATRGGF